MNEMDIYPIYPKMNLSKRMQQAKACPYLLRNVVIDKPNQAWSIDITYHELIRVIATVLCTLPQFHLQQIAGQTIVAKQGMVTMSLIVEIETLAFLTAIGV